MLKISENKKLLIGALTAERIKNELRQISRSQNDDQAEDDAKQHPYQIDDRSALYIFGISADPLSAIALCHAAKKRDK